MYLSQAITKAKSITDFSDIFVNNVEVQLGWINDQVTIEGYAGAVTTDFIAYAILCLGSTLRSKDRKTEDSKRLADLLANKVFIPLKNLVEAPENHCAPYQFAALTRIFWLPPEQAECFGKSIALKHAMVLGTLNAKYND